MQPELEPLADRPLLTWNKGVVIVVVTLLGGMVFFVWRPILLAPPLLEWSIVVYFLVALAWLPAFIAILLLRPTGSRLRAVVMVIAAAIISAFICGVVPAREFPYGAPFGAQLDCKQSSIPDSSLRRYTCTTDRMFQLVTYVLEGPAGAPFVWLVSRTVVDF